VRQNAFGCFAEKFGARRWFFVFIGPRIGLARAFASGIKPQFFKAIRRILGGAPAFLHFAPQNKSGPEEFFWPAEV
jgi:hypothetical protein